MSYVKCISRCETADHVVFERGKTYNRRGNLVKDGNGVTVYFPDEKLKEHFKPTGAESQCYGDRCRSGVR
jgi:hypothetical protein